MESKNSPTSYDAKGIEQTLLPEPDASKSDAKDHHEPAHDLSGGSGSESKSMGKLATIQPKLHKLGDMESHRLVLQRDDLSQNEKDQMAHMPHRPPLGQLGDIKHPARPQPKQLSPNSSINNMDKGLLLSPVHSPLGTGIHLSPPSSGNKSSPGSGLSLPTGEKHSPPKADHLSPLSSFSPASTGKIDIPPLGELVTPKGKSMPGLRTQHAVDAQHELSPLSARSLTTPRSLGPLQTPRSGSSLAPLRSTSHDALESPRALAKERSVLVSDELEHSMGDITQSPREEAAARMRNDHVIDADIQIEIREDKDGARSAPSSLEQPEDGSKASTILPIEPSPPPQREENRRRRIIPPSSNASAEEALLNAASGSPRSGQIKPGSASGEVATTANLDGTAQEEGEHQSTVQQEKLSERHVHASSEALAPSTLSTPRAEDASPVVVAEEQSGRASVSDISDEQQPASPMSYSAPEETKISPAAKLQEAISALTAAVQIQMPQMPPPNTPVRSLGTRSNRYQRTPSSTAAAVQVASATPVGPLRVSEAGSPRSTPVPAAVSSAASVQSSISGSQKSVSQQKALSPHTSSAALVHTPSVLKTRSVSNMSFATGMTASAEKQYVLHRAARQPKAAQEYEMSYNRAAGDLRTALLRLDPDTSNSKLVVRNIFRQLNMHDQAELTVQELQNFVLSPELGLFEPGDQRAVKYAELLMEQIDINGDGSVSIPELETFLFPPHLTASDGPAVSDAREIGVVIDFTRTAVRYLVSSVAALGSDEAILAEFAKLAKTTLKRGMLDTRLVKKAFLNIKIPEFGRCLYKAEVDSLVASIDCNDDGVVSAQEFKHWLFPAHKKEDQESLAQYLKKIITNSFDGDLWAMYREFCNGSEQMYKADFVIVLKTLDSAISRHEALAMANKIAGTDKMITMTHLQAALGLSAGRTFLSGEAGSVANSESVDMDGYSLSQSRSQSETFQSPRTKRRQRREQGSGGKLPTHEEGGGVSLLEEEGVGATPRTPKRDRAPRQNGDRTPGGDLGTEQDATEDAVAEGAAGSDLDEEDLSAEHLSDASDLSFESADEAEGDGGNGTSTRLGVSDAAVRMVDLEKIDATAPTQKEKNEIRDLLFGLNSSSLSPTKAPPALGNATLRSFDAALTPGESPRKTAGLVAEQVVALGYTQHTGRWRGFPYDTWSCCETNALHCPNPDRHRASTSPGASPSKTRLSLDSSSGSLFNASKSPPFIPAGSTAASKAPSAFALEIRHTSPTIRSRTPSPRKYSPRLRSPEVKTTPARPSTTGTKNAAAPKRTAPPATAKPLVKKPEQAVQRSAEKSREVHHDVGGPSSHASRRPHVVEHAFAVHNRATTAVKARTGRAPAKPAHAAQTHPVLAKTKVDKSAAPATPAAVAVVPPQPVPPSSSAAEQVSAGNTSVAAVDDAAVGREAQVPQPVQPDAATETPAEFSAPSAEKLVDQSIQQLTQQAPRTVPPEEIAPVPAPAAAELAEPTEPTALAAPPPASASPSATGTPKVILRPGVSSHAADPPQVQSPPIKMKFSVTVPKPADSVLPPDTAELIERLRFSAPLVDAHKVQLRSRNPAMSSGYAAAAEGIDPTQLALRATQELRELLEEQDAPHAESRAFATALLGLHSELDAVRLRASVQEREISEIASEQNRTIDRLQSALKARVDADDTRESKVPSDLPIAGMQNHLQVVGSAHSPSRSNIRTGMSEGFHLNPLDLLFPPQKARSPRGGNRSGRSRSAPVRRSGGGGLAHLSNSDSFFSAKVPIIRSPVARTPTSKPNPLAASTNRSAASAASMTVRVGTGTWVPTTPLHGQSFHRSPRAAHKRSPRGGSARRGASPAHRTRSLSPSALRSPASPTMTHKTVIVTNGVPRQVVTHKVAVSPEGHHQVLARRTAPIRTPSPTQKTNRIGSVHHPSHPGRAGVGHLSSSEAKHSESNVHRAAEISPQKRKLHSPVQPLATPPQAGSLSQYEALYAPYPPPSPPPPPLSYVLSAAPSLPFSPTGWSPAQLGQMYPTSPSFVPMVAMPAMQYSPATAPGMYWTPPVTSAPAPVMMPAGAVPYPPFAAPAAASNSTWWEGIQAQKRQHEKQAFEAELLRNLT